MDKENKQPGGLSAGQVLRPAYGANLPDTLPEELHHASAPAEPAQQARPMPLKSILRDLSSRHAPMREQPDIPEPVDRKEYKAPTRRQTEKTVMRQTEREAQAAAEDEEKTSKNLENPISKMQERARQITRSVETASGLSKREPPKPDRERRYIPGKSEGRGLKRSEHHDMSRSDRLALLDKTLGSRLESIQQKAQEDEM